jgi:PBP1b-binding outer membrane lipoprotein LpoB
MKRLALSFAVIVMLFSSGCGDKMPTHRYTQSDAEKKFLKIMREDNKLPVQLFTVEKTIWIYLPMEEDLVDYHGTEPSDEAKSKKQFTISTFEGDHKESQYRFMMDITDGIKTAKDPGYKSDASEAFIKNRLAIYGAIAEAFFDINEIAGDRHFLDKARDEKRQQMLQNYIPKGEEPEFIVVVIASIKKGLAYKTVLNINDYKLYRSEVLTSDEYNMREISELYGDQKLVNDTLGKSVQIKPITWTWFFIEQIKNRVNFKFLHSDFPPEKDLVIEIASIIADTFRYYDYTDYSSVLIKDLRKNESYTFNKPDISSFAETANKALTPNIRMHYITGTDQNTP